MPVVLSILGFLLPLIVFLVFVVSPKQSDYATVTVTQAKTDNFSVPRFLCLAVFVLGFLGSIGCYFQLKCGTYLNAYRVDSQGTMNSKKDKNQIPGGPLHSLQHSDSHNFIVNPMMQGGNEMMQPARQYQPFEVEQGPKDPEEGSSLLRRNQ